MSPFILAVLIALVVSIALSFVWYSPLVFGKLWMRLHGTRTDAKPTMKAMASVMTANAVATLFYVTAFTFVLAILIPMNAFSILICVLGLYLGFALPIVAQQALWSNLPKRAAWQVFGITAGQYLVQGLVIGIVFWLVR